MIRDVKKIELQLRLIEETMWLYKMLRDDETERSFIKPLKEKTAYTLFQIPLFMEGVEEDLNSVEREIILDARNYYKAMSEKEEKARMSSQERRHDLRNDSRLTIEEWENTKKHFNNQCAYCGSNDKLTYDHFIPFSKGGTFTEDNIIPACSRCNASKNDKEFIQWYSNQDFYSFDKMDKVFDFLGVANKCQQ